MTKKLTMLRSTARECSDGRTCPAVAQSDTGALVIVGRRVTDPDVLSQMAIGPDEIAVEVPGSLIPEVSGLCRGS